MDRHIKVSELCPEASDPNLPPNKPQRRMQVVRATRSHRSFAHGKRARGSERSALPVSAA